MSKFPRLFSLIALILTSLIQTPALYFVFNPEFSLNNKPYFKPLLELINLTNFTSLVGVITLTVIPFLFLTFFSFLIKNPEAKRFIYFYKYTVLLLGPFASLGCFLLFLFPSDNQLLQDYRDFMAEDVVFNPIEKLDFGLTKNYWESGESTIRPFVDIMQGSNSHMKRSTINKVVQHPGPDSRLILELGLKDIDQDIRFYAASALILLNDSFIDSFRDGIEKIEKNPDDPKLHLNLALAYDRYCSWNLPEKEDFDYYYTKMESGYRKVLDLVPHNQQAMVGLVKLLKNKDEMEEAEDIIEKGLELFPDSPHLTYHNLEVLFVKKNFEELQKRATDFTLKFPNIAMDIRENISFWVQVYRREDFDLQS